jgi:hypothetical protein
VVALAVAAVFSPAAAAVGGLLAVDIALKRKLAEWEAHMVGLEIATFTVVAAGIVLGPAWGAASGLVASVATAVSLAAFGPFLLWRIPGFAAAGALAGTVPLDPAAVGTAVPVSMRAFFVFMAAKFQPSTLGDAAIYETTAAATAVAVFQSFYTRFAGLLELLQPA